MNFGLFSNPLIAGEGRALFATTERRRGLELRKVEQLSRWTRELDLRHRLTVWQPSPSPSRTAGECIIVGENLSEADSMWRTMTTSTGPNT